MAWFDHSTFPAETEISFWASKGEGIHRSLRTGGEVVDLDSITAVWLWPPAKPVPHETVRGAAELHAEMGSDLLFAYPGDKRI